MATVVHYQTENFGPYRVIGKELRQMSTLPENPIPDFWNEMFRDNHFAMLQSALAAYLVPVSNDYVGYMRDYEPLTGCMTYVVGMVVDASAPVPEGYVGYDIPACKVARTWIQGDANTIFADACELTLQAIAAHGSQSDWAPGFTAEVYTEARFIPSMKSDAGIVVLDYIVPCL